MKVLVVEDDTALARSLRTGLVLEGFAVDVVCSLDDARDARRLNHYDLIVLDLGMPDGDGSEFLARLRSQGHTVPVLFLTARVTVVDRVENLNAGADDFLSKPFA